MIPTAATCKLIRSLLRKCKTDLGLFEDADSLSAEDLNNLAMLDPALLSEKEIAQAAQNQFDHAVQIFAT